MLEGMESRRLLPQSQGFVPGEVISRIVSSGGFRVALVGFFVFCAIYGSRLQDPAEAVHHTNHVSLRVPNALI